MSYQMQWKRAQMLYEMVSESTLGLTDVKEATSGAVDTVDQVDGCAGDPLSDVEDLFWALNGGGKDKGRGPTLRLYFVASIVHMWIP
eukprot:g38080.t1